MAEESFECGGSPNFLWEISVTLPIYWKNILAVKYRVIQLELRSLKPKLLSWKGH